MLSSLLPGLLLTLLLAVAATSGQVEELSHDLQNEAHRNYDKNGLEVRIGDYHVIGGRLYYIDTGYRTEWQLAQSNCNFYNMSMLSLETEEESILVSEYLKGIGYSGSVWTSGVRIQIGFYWTGSGHRFSFYNWAEGQPNDSNWCDVCVRVGTYDGSWYDDLCMYNYVVMCEQRP